MGKRQGFFRAIAVIGMAAGLLLGFESAISGDFLDMSTIDHTIDALKLRHGPVQAERIERGVRQAAARWRGEDGPAEAFTQFCLNQFIADPEVLQRTLLRFEDHLESLAGHQLEISRDFAWALQIESGPILPVDYLFSEYSVSAHVQEDLFQSKLAFVALLNFPLTTLTERLQQGGSWSRDQWAAARLAGRFTDRVPAAIQQDLTRAYVQADDYISHYNLYMHQLIDENGAHPFPAGLKLISHWGLRDELKAQYRQPQGLARQKMIQRVMERIIAEEIPAVMIDSEKADWDPWHNRVLVSGREAPSAPEADVRYQQWLKVFRAEQAADEYYPDLPSKIARSFERDREMTVAQVEALLHQVLSDPVGPQVAKLIRRRLGRNLQPFDIWYNGFSAKVPYDEAALDKSVSAKYPTAAAFKKDIPNILGALGFDAQMAAYLAGKIEVDPSRGVGHAQAAARRDDNAHLRTRVPEEGMRYKGYNIAVHELGHCVEQVLSLSRIDHTLLSSVPNTAFTEAFAFIFQKQDLALLGLSVQDPQARFLLALDTYWSTCEIGAVGLVDLKSWQWLYGHPDASPQQFKGAVMQIARDIWNQYYAPLIGQRDCTILAIYSHMIDAGLYLPDYAIGYIIMFQIEEYLQGENLGMEMPRMCGLGSITPDAWMRAAVGQGVSAGPLLAATAEALRIIR